MQEPPYRPCSPEAVGGPFISVLALIIGAFGGKVQNVLVFTEEQDSTRFDRIAVDVLYMYVLNILYCFKMHNYME